MGVHAGTAVGAHAEDVHRSSRTAPPWELTQRTVVGVHTEDCRGSSCRGLLRLESENLIDS